MRFRDAGLQPGNHAKVARFADLFLFRSECERHPQPSSDREAHGFAHDANHGEGASVELDAAADDVGVGGEAFLPESVAEDGDLIVSGDLVIRREGAAEERGDAEGIEEIWGYSARVDGFGVGGARLEREIKIHLFVGGDPIER